MWKSDIVTPIQASEEPEGCQLFYARLSKETKDGSQCVRFMSRRENVMTTQGCKKQ
jgi:hypothetical protein